MAKISNFSKRATWLRKERNFTEKKKLQTEESQKKFELVNGQNYSKFIFNDTTTLISLLFQTLVEWNSNNLSLMIL